MRRKLILVLTACVLIASAQPPALGKKNKKDNSARLKSLETIYVEGTPTAVSYLRSNLSLETCLSNAPEESEADAILDVEEVSPIPCSDGSARVCSSISAQLLDPKTNKSLWFTQDDNLPKMDLLHPLNGPYQWVLWSLRSTCCKGRPKPPPPKDSKQ